MNQEQISLSRARAEARELYFADETERVRALIDAIELDDQARQDIVAQATSIVERMRAEARPGLMEKFLAQYGLGTDEGVALMCLAEAYLRTPDAPSLDALITDKIGAFGQLTSAAGHTNGCKPALACCFHGINHIGRISARRKSPGDITRFSQCSYLF